MNRIRRKFLSVPDSFEANDVPSGTEVPSGIISRIRDETTDITSYIELRYSGDGIAGDLNTLIKWDKFAQTYGKDAFFQVGFKHGYVHPISYSIKGYNNNAHFAKEWYLYGFNEENEMTLLSENKSEGSTFCSTDIGCNNGNWTTFSVDSVQKAFKYFRMVCKTPSIDSNKFLMLGGIDIFGLYSIDGRTSIKLKCKTCGHRIGFSFYSKLLFSIYTS